ncbi:DUF3290 family protein [Aggregatibacter aphrophilus]|jgi:hypothetical protein|uniref:Protein of uncharacterized function (DUF3290) n=1 Tax=Aggregatibacter aphrophilus ATCC 33389 TaxID=985008 RepID=A0A448FB62_AGGAP|nr:DUF3290 family protein [Aggregatibacter aphrophilus]KNE85324.1 hypothetical protein ATCC33389_0205340 [Aggregatibacter aphrophilus ATCC 33389]MDU7785860.1 DUF3290 family protein [Aggregatibacter aphrophilus]OBY54536.1 hypothetical protein BBB51_05295 [Aggregatibacter aphrophilus]RDE88866.1 DUF3290 family protein [Aggregatibacter aphrophilus]RDE93256.1 DUF3290 family protein [Aggregatibacter aphrophilus]
MSFFSYFYLENRMYFQDYLKYIAIFVALAALLLVTTLYLRHRLETKYRDLSIIFLLLIVLLLGLQYNQYQQNQAYADNTSRMVTFLNSVKEVKHVSSEEIRVNSRSLSNGMILNIQDKYYEVHFNNDFSAYSLSPINLVNPNINLIDKEGN